MLDFQVEAIKNRDYLQPLFALSEDVYANYPLRNASRDFEYTITDVVGVEWLFYQNFASFDEVMKITPRIDDSSTPDIRENQEFLDGLVRLIKENKEEDYPNGDDPNFPSIVHHAAELGNYGLRLQPLRDELAKYGLTLELTEETEKNYFARCKLNQAQLDTFKYNPDMRNKMLEWTKTNTSNIIMIYGNSDPWYFVRFPETDNENIHVFVSSKTAHLTWLSSIEEDLKAEITALLDKWLLDDPESEGGNDSKHDSNSGDDPDSDSESENVLEIVHIKRASKIIARRITEINIISNLS